MVGGGIIAIPFNQLKAKYQEMADLFIDEVNRTTMTLEYAPQVGLTPNSGNFTEDPTIVDQFGGRVPITDLPNRFDEQGANLNVVPITETITVRSYWQERVYDQEGKVVLTNAVVKIISYLTDDTKLNNADTALVNGRRVRKLKSPVPYGLFEKRYSSSLWEEI